MACERHEACFITGLLRTLRFEDNPKGYLSLDLKPANEPWSTAAVGAIVEIFSSRHSVARTVKRIYQTLNIASVILQLASQGFITTTLISGSTNDFALGEQTF